MTTEHYVHGSTDDQEIARLEKQADFTASFTFPHITVRAGARVLDLATGVGAMGSRLQKRCAQAQVFGLDFSASQLAAARKNHPEFAVLRADGRVLPFADDTFDQVHWSWFLEHIAEPVAVLREVRRVLKPGGSCHFIEVDNATFSTSPVLEPVQRLMRLLDEAQTRAGGDGQVGQKLAGYLREAGFERFTLTPTPLHGSAANPALFAQLVVEFAEIYEGLDETVGQAEPELPRRASQALRSLLTLAGSEFKYTPVIVRAEKS
jgi:ubiquinone/menaquinone biosynthesis C-methylase UbiE